MDDKAQLREALDRAHAEMQEPDDDPRTSPGNGLAPADGAAPEQARDQAKQAAPPRIITAAEFVANYEPPAYTINGMVQKNRLYSLTASTGHGKTAVGLCCAVRQALGTSIGPHETCKGKVLYLSGENPDDVKARMIFMTHRMGLDLPNLPLWFVEGAFNITDALDALAGQARDIGGADTVYVDTSMAFMVASGFAEENSNIEVFRFASQLRKVTTIAGNPTTIALTHPIKHPEKDTLYPRGGGAFLAEVDGNLTLWANPDRTATELGWCGKFRGGFDPLSFALEKGTCPALVDANDRQVPSVWAYPITPDAAERAEREVAADQDALLTIMVTHPGSTLDAWAARLGWKNRQQVHRVMTTLKTEQLVSSTRGKWTLTAKGRKEAEKVEKEVKNGN